LNREEEVILKVNNTSQKLSSAVFMKDVFHVQIIRRVIEARQVIFNAWAMLIVNTPFGRKGA
jgi:acyl-CoA reductase-like NAD-dependent aldehyde dehydrogenase